MTTTLPKSLKNPAFLDFLAANPKHAAEIQALQKELMNAFNESVKKIAIQLAAAEKTPVVEEQKSHPASVNDLRNASTAHQQAFKAHLDLAQKLCYSQLVNANNPHWNPADASTYQAVENSSLVALLELGETSK